VEDDDIFTVEPMDEAHAMVLFEKKLGPQTDSKAATELATDLEFMPLAIIQATAYIKKWVPRLSVPQYLKIFQESDSHKISLLESQRRSTQKRLGSPKLYPCYLANFIRSYTANKTIGSGLIVPHEFLRQTRNS
jgi:hypothetical protein